MYYPLNKIKPNQYTAGNELMIKATMQNYTGAYYETYDGKFFSGGQPGADVKELIRVINSTSNQTIIERTYPTVTPLHYTTGFINRYFMRRVNGELNSIIEITEAAYDSAQKNPLYLTTGVLWAITDNLSDTTRFNYVCKLNQIRVQEAEKKMPGIKFYLTNYVELSK
jgi:hypothetical protein